MDDIEDDRSRDSAGALEEAALVHGIHEAYGEDLRAGREPQLEAYVSRWPEHRTLVEREFAELRRTPTESPASADSAFLGGQVLEGTRIGPYLVKSEVGRGAQGVVVRAVDGRLGRTVALKVLHAASELNPAAALRFQREAEAASRLDHPGLCRVHEWGQADGVTYLAMGWLEGRTFAERIEERRSQGAGPPRDKELDALIEQFRGIAEAVGVAHGQGILHRDLKPGNLMLTDDGRPVVLDFGLAGGRDAGLASLTATGDLFGTPAYMAPEQIDPRGGVIDRGGSAGRAADVYSLGVSLFECATLRRPFGASTFAALVEAIRAGQRPRARRLNPSIGRDLERILDTAMDPDPKRRFASAGDLAEDLRRLRAKEPILARPASVGLKLRRWTERNPAVATLAVGLFLVIATALVVTRSLLEESETQRIELAQALDDAQLGRRTQKELEVEAHVLRGYQLSFGADPRGADDAFLAALALRPDEGAAIAGLFLLELPDIDAARARLRTCRQRLEAWTPGSGEMGARHRDQVLADIEWMGSLSEGMAESRDPDSSGDSDLGASNPDASNPDASDRVGEGRDVPPEPSGEGELRSFLRGHLAVGFFAPPVNPEAARGSLAHFRRAALRAIRPRFHVFHSWMMAAHHGGDREAMEEAEVALRQHWPDAQATHEALAQFWFPYDEARALAALERILEFGESATAHLGLGFHHQSHGRHREAIEEFGAAVAIDPGFAVAHLMLAEGHAAAGDPRSALDALGPLFGLEPALGNGIPHRRWAQLLALDSDAAWREGRVRRLAEDLRGGLGERAGADLSELEDALRAQFPGQPGEALAACLRS